MAVLSLDHLVHTSTGSTRNSMHRDSAPGLDLDFKKHRGKKRPYSIKIAH